MCEVRTVQGVPRTVGSEERRTSVTTVLTDVDVRTRPPSYWTGSDATHLDKEFHNRSRVVVGAENV